jgi:hypothetical protein
LRRSRCRQLCWYRLRRRVDDLLAPTAAALGYRRESPDGVPCVLWLPVPYYYR